MRQFFIISILISIVFSCKKDNSEVKTSDLIVANDKVWYISEYPDPCPSCVWPHKIFLGEDTTINSKFYKKVVDCVGDSLENNCSERILGYIRETGDKKVYWFVSFFGRDLSDILLYDFNAKINDTIDNWIVSKIDTVKVQNIERKRITLENCTPYSKTWIEGIGDMSDLLAYVGRTVCDYQTGIVIVSEGGSGYKQTCVKQGNDFVYKDTEDSECWIYKGL